MADFDTNLSRRRVLGGLGSLAAAVSFAPAIAAPAAPHVVIVGAGFAGTTAAKYLKRFNPSIKVTVIEPGDRLVCCPMSIRVICGNLGLRDISVDYAPFFAKYDIRWVNASVDAIDTAKQQVRAGKETIDYDKLIVCTGVHFDYSEIQGMQTAKAQAEVPHAWRAGPQTIALRDRLTDMRKGGVFGLYIPGGPMKAKTAAYERVSMVANYFKNRNPRGKIVVFDAGAQPPYGKGVITSAWASHYGPMIEYLPNCEILLVDAAGQNIDFKLQGRHKLDLLNLIPPQRAPDLLVNAGLTGSSQGKWCPVDYQTFASTVAKNVYVLGDVITGVNGLPKAGQMANQEAKVCAAAIAAQTLDRRINPAPVMIYAGYTYITPQQALTTTTVYRYDSVKRQPVPMPASVTSSTEPNLNNGLFGMGWSTNILNDMMG
jgi:sulfide dehydrogenase [flavocytochrome c] flavoprotein chain